MTHRERLRLIKAAKKASKKASKAVRKLTSGYPLSEQAKRSFKRAIAKDMRLNPTRHEAILLDAMIAADPKPQTQVLVGPYIVDFCFPEMKIIVEADGKFHASRMVYDAARDAYMLKRNYKVIRIPNREITTALPSVMARIREAIQSRREWGKRDHALYGILSARAES